MSATAQELVNFALGEVGYSRWDDPLPGTKYGRWYADLTGKSYFGQSGVPFCAMGMSYCAHMVGVNSPVTPSAVAFDEGNDLQGRYVDKWELKPGDFVSFDWDDDTSGDHVGITKTPLGDGWYETIEFNTGDGIVAICQRHVSSIICGCRPWYDDAEDIKRLDDALDIDGVAGPHTISKWQQAMGTEVDGVISGQLSNDAVYRPNIWSIEHDEGTGSELVKAIQRKFGLEDDGLWGPKTSSAIQQYLKDLGFYDDEIDGYFGRHSVEALQRSLNESKW